VTAEDRLHQALQGILGKLDLDLAAASRLTADLQDIVAAAHAQPPTRGEVALAALTLDHYYTSLESSFEEIARVIDGALPGGADWHRALLAQMAGEDPARPAVLRSSTAGLLRELLKFRHFVRHAYAVELDWSQMAGLAAGLVAVHAAVVADLDTFRAFVASCLAAATGPER